MASKSGKNWGFDPQNIDRSIRAQDDFYHFANGTWIKRNKIPADESRWGSFTMLRYKTEHQLKAVVETALLKHSAKKKATKGSPEQLIADLYRSALDMKSRNKLGIKPIEPMRAQVAAIADRASLMKLIAKLHRLGISVPWEFYLDQDAKNSAQYLLTFTQDGIGLPEREYYLSKAPEQVRVRTAYIAHIEKSMQLCGKSKTEAAHIAKVVMKIETKLAEISMRKEDLRNPDKTYHKMTLGELGRLAPHIDWVAYCKTLGAGTPKAVDVAQPKFFKAVARMLATLPLEEWKIYLDWHICNEAAPLLSDALVKQTFEFYGKVLTGSKQMRAPWRRALGAVSGTVGEALGKLYVRAYFAPAAKRRMDALVDDLFEAYAARIKSLSWMSAQTKKKALIKLRAMNRKIGYPTKFETYASLIIKPDDFFGNMLRAHEFGHTKMMRRLQKPVDRSVWFMTPQTVNAYCHFNLNEIVFPAAILQAPFFSMDADDAVNYGAIGSVIGHEITHGFDDQGSKFDAKGNMRSWWTKADRTRFDARARVLINQYNQFTVADGVKANGELTVGENIADLGGLSIAFDAHQNFMKRTGMSARNTINGFTPEQRFFLGYAATECELERPEVRKMHALIDTHSAGDHRVNGPVSNLQSFYDAFSVSPKDKLYRSPASRAEIW